MFILKKKPCVKYSERPKGVFPLTAATVIRPQELCLIAAERAYFGQKKPYGIAAVRPLSAAIYSYSQSLGHRMSILRPKEHISGKRALLPQYHKRGGVAAATERLLRP